MVFVELNYATSRHMFGSCRYDDDYVICDDDEQKVYMH